jgi:hypothetical protein
MTDAPKSEQQTEQAKQAAPAKAAPALSAEEQVAYLQELKQEAQLLGIQFSGNISADSLVAKIDEHKKVLAAKKAAASAEIDRQSTGETYARTSIQEMTNANLEVAERRRHAKLLHRVIVTCHDPAKSKLPGRIMSVGNTAFGVETKYIAFNQPWHISTMMLNALKEKSFLAHYTVKDQRTGREITKHRLVPEFSIQTLPPMTDEELRVLAEQQKLRDSGESAR